MKCPVDGTELKIADRQGIEIDYCPKCRGVWLDRGELDRLIERAAQMESQPVSAPPRRENRDDFYPDDDNDYDYKRKNDERYRDDDRSYPQGKKKKSFLGDVFDIFG